jgi:hypothetical protein
LSLTVENKIVSLFGIDDFERTLLAHLYPLPLQTTLRFICLVDPIEIAKRYVWFLPMYIGDFQMDPRIAVEEAWKDAIFPPTVLKNPPPPVFVLWKNLSEFLWATITERLPHFDATQQNQVPLVLGKSKEDRVILSRFYPLGVQSVLRAMGKCPKDHARAFLATVRDLLDYKMDDIHEAQEAAWKHLFIPAQVKFGDNSELITRWEITRDFLWDALLRILSL